MKKWKWLVCGLLAGVTPLSLGIASVPRQGSVVSTSSLSEIHVAKELEPNFDGDVTRLAQLEGRYHENLPALRKVQSRARVAAPAQRLKQQKYRYSGNAPLSQGR